MLHGLHTHHDLSTRVPLLLAESSADEGGNDGSEEVGSKENAGSTFADGRGPTSNATEGVVPDDAPAAANDDALPEATVAEGALQGPSAMSLDAAASS